jgi:thiamine-phosphate pyrophosphorylase
MAPPPLDRTAAAKYGEAIVSRRARLYLITPPAFDLAPFSHALEDAFAGGDVACVQLRLKAMSDADILRIGAALKPIVQDAGAAFILNDRPDLAARLDADGVHVGQADASYAQARAAVGKDGIVGVTCHDSRHLAMEAAEAGADYVAFGAFYPPHTKAPKTRAELELLEIWSEIAETPCVAIGGINVENAAPLVRAGADFLAVSAGVWTYAQGPRAAVAAFNDVFDAAASSPSSPAIGEPPRGS